MKKLWILLMTGMSVIAYGKELHTFSAISDALKHGNSIRIVVQPETGGPKNAFSFFAEVDAVILLATHLQFANTHLTTNHPGLENKPVLENVTYRISDSGEVSIKSRVITLPDYQVKDEHSLSCILGRSAKVYTENNLKNREFGKEAP